MMSAGWRVWEVDGVGGSETLGWGVLSEGTGYQDRRATTDDGTYPSPTFLRAACPSLRLFVVPCLLPLVFSRPQPRFLLANHHATWPLLVCGLIPTHDGTGGPLLPATAAGECGCRTVPRSRPSPLLSPQPQFGKPSQPRRATVSFSATVTNYMLTYEISPSDRRRNGMR